MNNVSLDSRTVLLKTSIQDILKRSHNKRKGIDFRLYTANPNDKDKQTVMTFLSSMDNPNPEYQRDKDSVDVLLSEALDKVLVSDRVRSCTDFYKTNNKKDSSNRMQVD